MKTASRFLRTFVAAGCLASFAACVDGDDAGGPGGSGAPPAALRSFEVFYEGEKLSWRPAEGESQAGLAAGLQGDAFVIDAVLLELQEGSSGILKDDGYAGIVWKQPGGMIKTGEFSCSRGEVVIAIQFPHAGHLVTHSDKIYGGVEAMPMPVTEGVGCTVNVTRADKVGGFVEGTINATLAFVPFQTATAEAATLKTLTAKFRLTRDADR